MNTRAVFIMLFLSVTEEYVGRIDGTSGTPYEMQPITFRLTGGCRQSLSRCRPVISVPPRLDDLFILVRPVSVGEGDIPEPSNRHRVSHSPHSPHATIRKTGDTDYVQPPSTYTRHLSDV